MFFPDLLSPEDRKAYEATLGEFYQFVSDCNKFLQAGFDLVNQVSAQEQRRHHATVLMLVRHVIESLDGVSFLVAKGSSQSAPGPQRHPNAFFREIDQGGYPTHTSEDPQV